MKRNGHNYKKGKKNFHSDTSIFHEGKSFRGVLISCQKNQEKFAVRDAYRILNDNFERMFGQKHAEEAERKLDERLVKEVTEGAQIEVKTHEARQRLFNQIRVEATGLVFIKFDDDLFPKNVLVKTFTDEIFKQAVATEQVPSK